MRTSYPKPHPSQAEVKVKPGIKVIKFESILLKLFHMWRSQITKIVNYRLVYNAWCVILLIPYGFGKEWNSSCFVCKSMGLWVWAHGCHVGGSTWVGSWGDYVTNCHIIAYTSIYQLITNFNWYELTRTDFWWVYSDCFSYAFSGFY